MNPTEKQIAEIMIHLKERGRFITVDEVNEYFEKSLRGVAKQSKADTIKEIKEKLPLITETDVTNKWYAKGWEEARMTQLDLNYYYMNNLLTSLNQQENE